MKWTRKTSESPTVPTVYPLGSFIHTEKGYFYILNSEKRLRILSKRVLDSWSPLRVIETTEAVVLKYRITAKMGFRNGSLITNISNGRIYLIEEGNKRHIGSPDVLDRLGAKPKDVVCVSNDEINLHEDGKPIT